MALLKGDVADPPVRPGDMDLVLLAGPALETDDDAMLAAAARALRPGGRVVLASHDDPVPALVAAGLAVHATSEAPHTARAVLATKPV